MRVSALLSKAFGIYMYLVSHSGFSVYIDLFTLLMSKMLNAYCEKEMFGKCACFLFHFGEGNGSVYSVSMHIHRFSQRTGCLKCFEEMFVVCALYHILVIIEMLILCTH